MDWLPNFNTKDTECAKSDDRLSKCPVNVLKVMIG